MWTDIGVVGNSGSTFSAGRLWIGNGHLTDGCGALRGEGATSPEPFPDNDEHSSYLQATIFSHRTVVGSKRASGGAAEHGSESVTVCWVDQTATSDMPLRAPCL